MYTYGVQNTNLTTDTRILVMHQVVSSQNMIRTVKRKMMQGINTSKQKRRIQPQNVISKLPKNVLEIHKKKSVSCSTFSNLNSILTNIRKGNDRTMWCTLVFPVYVGRNNNNIIH